MSRRSRHGLVLSLAAALSTVLPVATAVPASATEPPVLDSVSVSSTQVTTPGAVTVSYTAHSTDPITQALAGYTDEGGRLYSVTLSVGTTGLGELKLPDGVRNGLWKLQYVYLSNGVGVPNPTYVCRTGRSNSACTEFRDFSAYDVTVSGSTWDTAAPVVTSLALEPASATAGGQVTVSFTAQEVHRVTRASVTLRNTAPEALGNQVVLSSSDVLQLAERRFTALVPSGAYDGEYVLVGIVVWDDLGNWASYRADGTVTISNYTTAPTTHAFDFAAIRLSVTGSTVDVTPPILTSISADSRVVMGELVTVRYETTETQSGLSSVSVAWTRDDGVSFGGSPVRSSWPTVGDFTMGTARLGVFHVQRVWVYDRAGNYMYYDRDGTTYNSRTGEKGAHTLDLGQADVTVVPRAVPNPTASSRPQGVLLSWGVGRDEAQDIIGYRVTVQPGGRVLTAPQLPADTRSRVGFVVGGLVNGVTYTFSIVPRTTVGDGPAATVTGRPMQSDHIFAFGGPRGPFGYSDSNQDGRTDVFAVSSPYGSVYRYLGNGRSGFASGRQLVDAETGGVRVVSGGNLAHLHPTVLVVRADGRLELNATTDDGHVWAIWELGGGWGSMRFIDGSVDLTGDGYTDILAVTQAGDLLLYRGHIDATVSRAVKIGQGWGSMLSVFSPGDISGDRYSDVVAVDAAGGLWLYRGNGRGGWLGPRVRIGSGWAGFGAVFAARDLSGDGRMDLGAVTMAGDLMLYAGRGNATFNAPVRIGQGWHGYF